MSNITLNKISDYKIGDVVIDYDWDVKGEGGTIIEIAPDSATPFEIFWPDGLHTSESLADVSRWEHVVTAPFVNYPTLLPSQGHTTDRPDAVDYADGYGVEYAVGE